MGAKLVRRRDTGAVDVLVVDDDESVRCSTADVLRQAGYVVAEAQDGLEAIDFLEATLVRVLLLDVRMPRMDGISLMDALDRPPPIIVVSAQAPEPETLRSNNSVLAWLQKPASPTALLAAVEQATKS